jgi:tannase/feruloyl esterase
VHRTAEVAKTILRSYYGTNEAHDYFAGCSNGGREALMEAQRFPDDFEGIVAGAPALDFVAIGAHFIRDTQAAFPDGKTPIFTPDVVKSVGQQILDKCDALDGVTDGILDDPRKCAVDVSSLTGVTDAQKAALKKIYAPVGTIYPGQPFGGETEMGGWPSWITGGTPMQMPQGPSLRYAFGTQFFKYFVFGDSSWDYTKYDVSNAPRDGRRAGLILNANNPDLSAFKSKGHKLILWHGWADAGLTPLATVKYYEDVKARDASAADYTRLFMMPGVLHCGGGPGADTVDWAAAIDAWVGGNTAPDRLVARKLEKDQVTRTRPLCPYPQHAVYAGHGSTDDEKSFVCR